MARHTFPHLLFGWTVLLPGCGADEGAGRSRWSEAGDSDTGGGDSAEDEVGEAPGGAVLWLDGPAGSQAGRALAVWGEVLVVGGFAEGPGAVWLVDAGLEGRRSLVEVGMTISGVSDGDGFGRQVAAGEGGLLVGAPYVYEEAGAVYEILDELPTEVLAGEAAGDWMGRSLAWVADLDDSGEHFRLTGATGWGSGAGAAYLWLDPYQVASRLDGERASWVGYAVAAAGDTDGDGLGELAVGGPGDGSAEVAGAVWLWEGRPPDRAVVSEADRALSGSGAADRFGFALAGEFDQDGDGKDDLLVGAPGAGEAWLVRADEAVLLVGSPEGEFGYAVDADDTRVAVAARLDATGGDDAGAVWVFEGWLSGTVEMDAATFVGVGEPGGTVTELALTADGVFAGQSGLDAAVLWAL